MTSITVFQMVLRTNELSAFS